MDKNPPPETFPRRDADGRVISLRELLFAGALGTVIGVGALALIDGVLDVLNISTFGKASGWLASILPALLYFDDLRAWRGRQVRFLVAAVGAGVAIGLGLIASALTSGFVALVSGAAGAIVAVLVYALVWFAGIRWLTGEMRQA